MSDAEIRANIHHFTEGMKGPRTSPCDTLVLSGVGVAGRPDTPETITNARALGVSRVVLHAGVEDLGGLDVARFVGLVDVLVVPVQPGNEIIAAARAIGTAVAAGLTVHANTALTSGALPELASAARLLVGARPHLLTFTYPFPINGGDASLVPTPPRAVAALRQALIVLDGAGVPAVIKGLAACYLGPDASRLRRTLNRWYVDADHQLDQALMFFPDVVSFHKDEVCRFCPADAVCDGFFAAYLRRAGTPPLRPLEPGSPLPS